MFEAKQSLQKQSFGFFPSCFFSLLKFEPWGCVTQKKNCFYLLSLVILFFHYSIKNLTFLFFVEKFTTPWQKAGIMNPGSKPPVLWLYAESSGFFFLLHFSLLCFATYCFSIVLGDIRSRLLSWQCCGLKDSARKEASDSLQSGSKARGIHSAQHSAQHLQFSYGSPVPCRYLASCIATNWRNWMTKCRYLADNQFNHSLVLTLAL